MTSRACLLGLLVSMGACSEPADDDFGLSGLFTFTNSGLGTDPGTDGTEDPGDGDGDGPGDGDGDEAGDGDGSPTGDGDGSPTGDGDGSPTGDGDGDPTDGCTLPNHTDPDLTATHSTALHDSPLSISPGLANIGECDVFLQDCPGGEKCVPYASQGGTWDSNKCVPILGNGAAGESCTYAGVIEATDDCNGDTACWNINNDSVGTCTPFCAGTPQNPQCDPGTSCLQGNQGSIAFCVEGCNPLSQNCEAGKACYWTADGFSCVFTTADIPSGQACGFINDCAKGNFCTDAAVVPNCNGSACCVPFCDLDCGPNSCGLAGTSCVAFFDAGQAPAGFEDVGVCILP